jgi:hypothetical protein
VLAELLERDGEDLLAPLLGGLANCGCGVHARVKLAVTHNHVKRLPW